MKLRYPAIFCILCILISPVLSIETQTNNHIFSAQTPTKASSFNAVLSDNQTGFNYQKIRKISGNQDGQNITNAISIFPGNTCHKELEAHETIYFCTPWQQNISCDVFSDTPKMLSCSLLSDTGETLSCQRQIQNNKITLSCSNSSPDEKGQYIFLKITNERNSSQTFQLKLHNTPLNVEETEQPKNTPKPKQTAKPKSTPSIPKQTNRPKSTPSIPKQTIKPKSNPPTPRQTIAPKYTTKPANLTASPDHTSKSKNNSSSKSTLPTQKQTAAPNHTARPKNNFSSKNTLPTQKQTAAPDHTAKLNSTTPFPKETVIPQTTIAAPSQSPESQTGFSYSTENIPPLEEHFLELKVNTSYQLTINNTTANCGTVYPKTIINNTTVNCGIVYPKTIINDISPSLHSIIWSSTNPEIVSVEQGKLEIHSTGTAVIYCHYPQTERGSSCFVYCC